MLAELLILSGSIAAAQNAPNRRQRSMLPSRTRQGAQLKLAPSRSNRRFHALQFLREIKQVIRDEGRQKLLVDINPRHRKELEKARARNKRDAWISTAAVGLAYLGSATPLFGLAGISAVLYLSKDTFIRIQKDFKKGHYLTVYSIGLIMLLTMIATGHLLLAAFAGLIEGFFARIINRLEDDSQKRLISVFSGHPAKVWLAKGETEVQIDFQAIKAGDVLMVNAGEVIPADGTIHHGEGQVDQHLLTGESQSVEKRPGDPVFASTILLSGRLAIKVSTAGKETMASQIGQVLNRTQSYKDTLKSRGRKISDRFLPLTAGLGALTVPLMGANAAIAVLWSNLGGIMAPLGSLSVLGYLQILSRQNILIKDGRVFELLGQIDTIVFDKTGTLTLEQPSVCDIHVFGHWDEPNVLRYAAAAEYRQPHPIAKAIIARAEMEGITIPKIDQADYEVGFGIKVTLNGEIIHVGSRRFLDQEGISLPTDAEETLRNAETHSHSLIFVAVDGQLAGILELEPTIRPEAASAIQFLKQRGLKLCILSGDHQGATARMAETLGIDDYFAEVLPKDKAAKVRELKEQGRFVCFVGDGINDAIALKEAHVGVSLKGASTAATDTAQVILMDGTLEQLYSLFKVADEFEETMKRNLTIAIAPGALTIGGVYLLHFGILAGMGIFYVSCAAGIGNILWPLIKHQNKSLPSPKC